MRTQDRERSLIATAFFWAAMCGPCRPTVRWIYPGTPWSNALVTTFPQFRFEPAKNEHALLRARRCRCAKPWRAAS